MHEYAIVRALLDRVGHEARARGALRVHRVRVRLGAAAGVDGQLLATAFDAYREAGGCPGAELDVVPVPVRWECGRCGGEVAAGDVLRCPGCGRPARLAQGDELILDRIEMEVA